MNKFKSLQSFSSDNKKSIDLANRIKLAIKENDLLFPSDPSSSSSSSSSSESDYESEDSKLAKRKYIIDNKLGTLHNPYTETDPDPYTETDSNGYIYCYDIQSSESESESDSDDEEYMATKRRHQLAMEDLYNSSGFNLLRR